MHLTNSNNMFRNKVLCIWKNINTFTTLNLKFNLT